MKVERLGETQSSESQTEMRERDYTVRQFPLSLNWALAFLMYTWTRKGKPSRVIYFADIQWKVPFNHTRAKSA